MPLFGDHYVGAYLDHPIELVRNNWDKTLTLRIDGEAVARTSCHLPRTITLSGELEHGGVRHEVVARSVPRHLIFATDSIEVDGAPLELTQATARGNRPRWATALIVLSGVALLGACGALLLKLR